MADAAIIAVELNQIYEATATNALSCKVFRRFFREEPVQKYLTLKPNQPEEGRLKQFFAFILNIFPEYVLQKDLINEEVKMLAKTNFDVLN